MPGAQPPAADLVGVTKRFTDARGNKFPAVDDVSFRIQPGEVVAFLGPNGAGKTTTIDMLLGLTKPDAGKITVFGVEPLAAARTGKVSVVLQTDGLLPELTVEATVRMVGSLHPNADVERAIARAGLTELRNRKVGACSGGEKQRLRFALALLPNPDFMVLDEPTAGMDVTARQEFWAAVRADAQRGMTVMFATHYLEEADRFADRVIMLDHGRILADGSTSDIRAAVAGRTVSAVVSAERAADAVAAVPGARVLETRGERVYFAADDSDALLRALLNSTDATDVEAAPRSLEDAFVAITQHAKEGIR
ncbi:ABC-2 type transport system ATP-binding protein [Labedaea rhizosphaerae]|uniref:ABC-2 type transport system ATP-binding protein n=1 Tax=Labedaea rhizosphaerae TaxID=598644 RepID=A0A4R6S996_LABRH|nr:ABC-2 type transport system ATP-binding protein [Labedaea rhizosphaerae]